MSQKPNSGARGYELLGSQTLDASAKADLKEAFQIGIEYPADHPYVMKYPSAYASCNPWPASLPEFKPVCKSYFGAVATLSSQIMQLIALSLGLPDTYFSGLSANSLDVLRLLWYPPQPADADERTLGSHTDWGAITILAQDAQGGLEVQMPDSKWISADPVPDTFVVNLGDMIPRWTNGRYRSNFHRVIHRGPRARCRQSAAFFVDLDYEAVIEPIDSLAAGVSKTMTAFTVREHLEEMVRKSYGLAT